MEEVGKVIGQPTFTKENKVILALKTNCIAMEDTRLNLMKLHCIMDTAHLEATDDAIPPSVGPGALAFNGLVLTEARYTHLIWYTQQKFFCGSQTRT
jgi:hypothetical protein